MLDSNLDDAVKRLKHKSQSKHFTLHYCNRIPASGPGLSVDGIADVGLLNIYHTSLERLYEEMVIVLNRTPPPTDKSGRTSVYMLNIRNIFTGCPFTASHNGVPFVVLPNRNYEPLTEADHMCAASNAVHEATHLFNYVQRPFDRLSSAPWEWFDEATAVYMEGVCAQHSSDCLRYAFDWVDHPEIPLDSLDSPLAYYRAGWFVKYLADRFGPKIVSEVWKDPIAAEGPLDALQRVLTANYGGLEIADIFGSGYCMDALRATWDDSIGFAADAVQRCGQRAIRHCIVLKPSAHKKLKDSLDHLACHYYRVHSNSPVASWEIVVKSEKPSSIRAEVIAANAPAKSEAHKCCPNATNSKRLECRIGAKDIGDGNEFYVVVSNCGLRASSVWPPSRGDDDTKYAIEIAAS